MSSGYPQAHVEVGVYPPGYQQAPPAYGNPVAPAYGQPGIQVQASPYPAGPYGQPGIQVQASPYPAGPHGQPGIQVQASPYPADPHGQAGQHGVQINVGHPPAHPEGQHKKKKHKDGKKKEHKNPGSSSSSSDSDSDHGHHKTHQTHQTHHVSVPPVHMHTVQTHVVNATPMVAVAVFGSSPVNMVCPHCHSQIFTSVNYTIGLFTIILCAVILLLGCWLGCCLIPLCVNPCKDCIHSCPHCHHELGRFKRM